MHPPLPDGVRNADQFLIRQRNIRIEFESLLRNPPLLEFVESRSDFGSQTCPCQLMARDLNLQSGNRLPLPSEPTAVRRSKRGNAPTAAHDAAKSHLARQDDVAGTSMRANQLWLAIGRPHPVPGRRSWSVCMCAVEQMDRSCVHVRTCWNT